MITKRLCYIAALVGCVVFYIAYQAWFSTLLLWTVVLLPLVSLLAGLPSIRRFELQLTCEREIDIGDTLTVSVSADTALPYRVKLRLRRCITGEEWRFGDHAQLPVDHCGAIAVSVRRAVVYDPLGLIGIPVRLDDTLFAVAMPTPLETALPAEMDTIVAVSWRPKAGGGFSEYHEMRDYRPGDSLKHIHWKLTAKRGEPILREPMQPELRWLLMLDVCGTPEELDRKFGRLLFLGRELLRRGLPFEIAAMTEKGLLRSSVVTVEDLEGAVSELLCMSPTVSMTVRDHRFAALRQHEIGGEPS